MSPENKQRVVGIIVLVAFIALLIPFLFTSGIKKKEQSISEVEVAPVQLADTNAPAVEANSLEVVSDKLPGDISQQAEAVKPEILPPPGSASVSVNAGANPDINTPVIVTTNEASTNVPVANVTVNEPATVVKAEDEPVVNPQPIKVEEPTIKMEKSAVKTKSVTAKTKKAKKKAAGKVTSRVKYWSVQVGSFSDEQRMQKFVSILNAKGYKVYLQKINTSHGLMVRVLVGHEATKEQANKIAAELQKKLKINGRVVGNKK